MEDQIREDLKQAQLAKDEAKVSTLRLLLSELTYAKVSKGADATLSDEEIISVVQKEMKKRREAVEGFRKGDREEQAQKEEAEIKVLEKYLPAQISDEELTLIVEESIKEVGAKTMADMGKVMSGVMGKAGQGAEGSRVSSIVKQKLSS